MKPTIFKSLKRMLIILPAWFSSQFLLAQNWVYIAGIAAQDIGVGRNGVVWATSTAGDVLRWNGTSWDNIPGIGSRVAVDAEGAAWVVTTDGSIYKYNLTTKYWDLQPGNAKDIGVGGDGSVWIIGNNAVSGGYDIYKWDWSVANWKNIPGGGVKIAVDPSGNAWIVNSTNNLLRYNGASWDAKPGSAKDIGVGADGTVWCTGTNDAIYKWDGTNWQGQSGGASWVSVAPDGNAWVVNAGGDVWHTNNPSKLPDFTKTDLKNVQHTLYSDLSSGKVVILDFSAVWCSYCNVSAPMLQTVYDDMKTRHCNVNVYMMLFEGPRVGVPCDSAAAAKFATRYSLTLPVITNIGTFYSGLTGQYTSQYIQNSIPFFIIITPNVQDPASSSVQIINGEYPNLVQMIESSLPTSACKK
jgi:thiol-disulfide isomerase/thioredoxin